MILKTARLTGAAGSLGMVVLFGAFIAPTPALASSDGDVVIVQSAEATVGIAGSTSDKNANMDPMDPNAPIDDLIGPLDSALADEPAVTNDPEYVPDSSTDSGTVGTLSTYVGNNSASHCSIDTPPCRFNIYKSSTRYITPPGGSYGQLKSYGKAYVDVYTVVGCCFTKADYYNTSSYSQWGGMSPWNATSIKHRDVWDIDYYAVSWSFGGSPSGTINQGSGRISYANKVYNTWKVTHSVQHVYLKVSGGRITRVKYEVHGSFQFGSSFYTTDAYSSVALP